MPQLLNKVNLPQYPSAPSPAVQGDLYYNTSDDAVYVWDGASWLDLTAAGTGSGSTVFYQTSAPSSPSDGDIWIDSDDEVVSVASVSDSTSTTSSSVAASLTAVKAAYDLANAAIPKSIVDSAGDIIVATGADTVAKLEKGSEGTVLSVSGGSVVWADVPPHPMGII